MQKIIKPARYLFAASLILFGIQHFIYGDFITGRAIPWPATINGGTIWAYASGFLLAISGLLIIARKSAVLPALISGVMIFIWAFLRNIPILVSHPVFDGFATNTGKALALSGGMFAIAHSLLNDKKYPLIINQKMVNLIEKLKLLSPFFIAIF